MRINEDYIETLSSDELTDDSLKTQESEHTYQYVVCFGWDTEKQGTDEAYINRLEKVVSSFPYVNRIGRLDNVQETELGSGTYMTVRNGSVDIPAHTVFELEFAPFGIDADFDNNTMNTFSFIMWISKLPIERIYYVLIVTNNEQKEFIIPGCFRKFLDFIEYRSEEFNSSERNPNRVAFAEFIENIAKISSQDIDDVIPYIFRRMNVIEAYVRADNRNRNETRISEELRRIVRPADALKQYRAYLSVLNDKYRDVVRMRYAEYQNVIDECLWSVPYKETGYDPKNCPRNVPMTMSAIGVKRKTKLCDSYIELAIFCDVRNQIVSILVAIVKDTKTFMSLLKDIIPDVSDEELLAIKKEISKLR